MSHSDDHQGRSAGSLTDRSVETLSEAAQGALHLVVSFEILADDKRADGGEIADPAFLVPEAEPDSRPDPESMADRGETGRATDPTDFGALADCEPFIDSVMRPDGSSNEYTDTAFGEAVDVESLVSYLGLDFVEHQLFADRFRLDADVVYTSRGVGSYQLLCVYLAGRGLLLVVDDDEAIRPLVGHARSLLEA